MDLGGQPLDEIVPQLVSVDSAVSDGVEREGDRGRQRGIYVYINVYRYIERQGQRERNIESEVVDLGGESLDEVVPQLRRERDKSLRALRPRRPHALGHVGVCDRVAQLVRVFRVISDGVWREKDRGAAAEHHIEYIDFEQLGNIETTIERGRGCTSM